MRINRFCEARGLYESDNSIESKIFCFGDDGPDSSSSTAASEDIGTADVDKGPGPGDPNTGGSGDGPTRDEIAARAGVNPDTIVGSGLGGRNPVMSGSGNPVKSGSAVAAEAAAKGVSVDEINSRINEASKAASNAAGIGAPSGPAPADLPGLDVPEFDEPAGAVNLEDALGFNPFEDFAVTPVTQTVRGPALGTTDYEFDALGERTALSPEQEASLTGMLNAEGVPISAPETQAQAARDDVAVGEGLGIIDNFDNFSVFDEDEFPAGAIPVGTLAGSPVQQVTRQATDPATSFAAASNLGLTDASKMAAREDEDAQGLGSLAAAPGTSYTGVGSLNYSPAPTSDPVGASIDRAISDFAGYREGQTRTQTPEGVMVDDFSLTRDLVSLPTEYGAMYSPLEQLRMQEGTRTVPAINVPDVDVFGMTIPVSIAGRAISDVLTPASALDRALQDPATRAIYDAQGRIEGAVDKYGTVYDATPYDFESSDAMKAAYAEQNRRQDADRQGGDGGGQIIPPPQEVVPEPPPEEYQGRDIVGGAPGYQPRGPISYDYTGLPSLAPTVLRPSYRPRGPYEALFPMGKRA